jgi:lantibiotic modifying enzyme
MQAAENNITITSKLLLEQSDAIAKQFLKAPPLRERGAVGVLAGLSGEALFLLYYAQLQEDENYYTLAHSLLKQAAEFIDVHNLLHTHCSGMAGFGWTIMYAQENELLNTDVNLLLQEIDIYLEKILFFDLDHDNYDFLHGALGTALYFLKRVSYTSQAIGILQKFVVALEKLAIRSGKSLKWDSWLNKEGRRVYNISLSHGMSSIVALLSKLYVSGIEKERTASMLHGAVHFIMEQQLDTGSYSSCFPAYAIESENNISGSRLAWCYGDLGIASALWMAGQATSNEIWKEKAIEVFLHASKRTNLQKESVLDAGLCHGTAGIAHIFNRMYYQTRFPVFEQTRNYWLQQTIRMATFEDGLAGYKMYAGKGVGYKNETNVLEGIAGIGLAFMAAADPACMSWDECLLLS